MAPLVGPSGSVAAERDGRIAGRCRPERGSAGTQSYSWTSATSSRPESSASGTSAGSSSVTCSSSRGARRRARRARQAVRCGPPSGTPRSAAHRRPGLAASPRALPTPPPAGQATGPARSASSAPAAVSSTRRPARRTSGTPASRSSARSCWETADGVQNWASATASMVPSLASSSRPSPPTAAGARPGTTAEHAALTAHERTLVLQICARVSRERGTVLIAGAGGDDTARAAALLTALRDHPEVGAALTVVPYYSRPGEGGRRRALPGTRREPPRSARDLQHPLPHGSAAQLVCHRSASRACWCHRHQARDRRRRPGHGADDGRAGGSVPGARWRRHVPVAPARTRCGRRHPASAHVGTADVARLVRLWRDGEAAQARVLGHRLAQLSAALFAAPNPSVIKAVLHRRGEIPGPAVRLPLQLASPAAADVAERLAA